MVSAVADILIGYLFFVVPVIGDNLLESCFHVFSLSILQGNELFT